jgi:cystathionine gamma-lyase
MSSSDDSRIARLLHHRAASLETGDPVSLPIVASSTFNLPGAPDGSHYYARSGHPTTEAVEAQIGILEEAEIVAFPSGMAAIAAVFYTCLKAGDRALLPSDGYYNTRALFETCLTPFGAMFDLCPTAEMGTADLEGYGLVMLETPSNPGLDVCDIANISSRARAAGVVSVVDNTTATPLLQRPLDLGADLTVTADTKAMAGHSDVLFGHVAGREAGRIEAIRTWRRLSGAIPGPFDAFLVHRGLETLEVRLARICANAQAVAEALVAHAAPENVRYPGLTGDPAHSLAARQMRAFGPIVCFELANEAAAEAFIDACPLLSAATSFGGVHSSAERRARWGDAVAPGFVRLSAGIEPTAELVNAITAALDTL